MAMIVDDSGFQYKSDLTDYQSGGELLYPELLGPPIAANYDLLSIKTEQTEYPTQQLQPQTELLTYSGQVIDAESGQPVPGATVIFLYQGGNIGQAVADKYGIFTIKSGLQPDIIRISSVGYQTFDFPWQQSASFELIKDYKTQEEVIVKSTKPKQNNTWLLLLLIPLILSKKKAGVKTVGELKATDVWPWVIIAAAFLGWKLIYTLLQDLGIFLSKEDKNVRDELRNSESPFSPTFWQKGPTGTLLLYEATAQKFVYDIYHALGFWHDDFDTIYGIFQTMKTKSQVSYLADKFQKRYNVGLLSFLNDGNSTLSLPWDGLRNSNLSKIIDLVNSLPDYKP